MYQAPLWHTAPFLRLLPPFTGGLIIAAQQDAGGKWLLPGLLITATLLLLTTWYHLPYRFRWCTGLLVQAFLVLTAMHIFYQQQWPRQSHWLGHSKQHTAAYIGSPETIVLPTEKTFRQVFRVYYSVDSTGHLHPCRGKIQVSIPKTGSLRPVPGETWLLAAAPLKAIQPDRHPGAFNYALYAARQNLFHQGYFQHGQLVRLQPAAAWSLSAFFARCQLSAIAAMRATISPNEQGLAMALLIGYRQEMDKDLLQAYNDTGTVHVIAVSGMHLGLLFLLLQLLLKWPIRANWFRWTKALLVLWMICWFSAVAGAAPSILRAALMFGFLTLGKLLFKPVHALQSLAFTAFCMLALDPNWCWDAGFQLSFAALGSIIIYQPLITDKITPRNPLLKQLWELTAVTLAAQVLTFPLSVYLFHQAPLYFLGSNLVAVPLSSVALITGLVQWGLFAMGIPFSFFGQLTSLMIQWMNAGIVHFRLLPGSVLRDLEWSLPFVTAVYGCIAAGTAWFLQRSKAALFALLMAVLALTGIASLENYQTRRQAYLLVYQQPGARMIDLICGDTVYEIGITPEKTALRRNAQRHFHIRRRMPVETESLYFGGLHLALPAAPGTGYPPGDILVLPPEARPWTDSLPPAYPLLLADGSMQPAAAIRWEQHCRRFQQAFHNGWKDGPLLLKVNINRNFAPP
ncbi:MAG: ComEC/Rec2 family competence protein [Flavihumibacter sp.]